METHQDKLTAYILQQLQLGLTPDEIAGQLTAAGWPADQVHAAFLAVQSHMMPTQPQPMQPAAAHPGPTAGPATVSVPEANGRRRGRIKTGWYLLKQSLRILRGNPYLLRYFGMTWVAVIVLNTVIVIVFFLLVHSLLDSKGNTKAGWYVLSFINYLVVYSAINFYAAALSRNILDIFAGNRKPYREYVRAARAKFWPIFVYSLIAAVIGLLIQFIIERLKWVGRILAWIIGTAWSIGTMFVLPIVMDSDASAGTAIKQSFGLFKKTWGENITAKVTVNAPLALINILLALLFMPLIFAALFSGGIIFFWLAVFVYLFIAISLAVVGSFANNLVNVALYYYAVHRQVPPGFDAEMLNQIFIKSKRRFFKKNTEAPRA